MGMGMLVCATALLTASIAASALPNAGVNQAMILGEQGAPKFPRSLSDYGFFLDAGARQPAANVIPYELNTALYSDGAEKLRYIVLPDGAMMQDGGEGGLLDLPVGAAIIKTFAFGEKYIETRVLLHRADGWLALPYKWNEEQTEAKLALVGARMTLTRPDGAQINYQIPNKNQCKNCHQLNDVVTPIGPKARNLSEQWLEEQVGAHRLAGLPDGHSILPDWDAPTDGDRTEALARAYLDVNCAHCHRPGGSASNSGLDLRWEQDDPHAIGIRKPPVAAGRGAGGHAVSILPGNPDESIMVFRMSSTEPGVAMPELGRSTNDDEGIAIVRAWIEQMEPAN